jgi:hypothetical protein
MAIANVVFFPIFMLISCHNGITSIATAWKKRFQETVLKSWGMDG